MVNYVCSRKWIAIVAVVLGSLALSVSVFAGGQGEAPGGETAADENFNATGYPIVDSPVTLTAISRGEPADDENFNDLPMFQALEEKTHVRIEWTELGTGFQEKLSLMVASGDLKDIVYGRAHQVSDELVAGRAGNFLPLRGLIDEYAPNIKRFMEVDPIVERTVTWPDGEIYSLPNAIPHRPATYGGLAINKDWLDKLGLDLPADYIEYEAALRAFVTQDPNGNGRNDEIGYVPNRNENFWYGVFGIPRRSGDRFLQLMDGEVRFIPTTEEWRTMVGWFHKLFREGLWDQEGLSQDGRTAQNKMRSKDPRIVGSSYTFTINYEFGTGSLGEYVYIYYLPGPDGEFYTNDNTFERYRRNAGEISRMCEMPEVAIRWFDAQYTEDMAVQLMYGSFGEQVRKVGNRYEMIPPPEGTIWGDWKWNNAVANFGPIAFTQDLIDRTEPPDDMKEANELAAAQAPYRELGHAYPLNLVFFERSALDELATLKTDIEGYITENYAKWIAKGGIDEEWNSFVDRLEAMGLQRYLEIHQEAYDNFMSK